MRKEIEALRSRMKECGIQGYIVPTTDFHGSEYVNEYFKCRQYLTGFTGSEGTLVVTADRAALWTDGRYFLQAEQQLSGSGIELMKMGQPGVPTVAEFLDQNLKEGSVLGFDGRVVTCREGESYAQKYRLEVNLDLAGDVWTERPALKASSVYALPLEVTGETAESKLARVRHAMEEAGADYHLMTRLEQIAWLYNLRGDDVKYTPVFFAYALIGKEQEWLYVLDEGFDRAMVPATTEIRPYAQVMEDLRKLAGGKILLDKKGNNYSTGASYALVKAVPDCVEIIDQNDPCEMMAAVKNEGEIRSTKEAHRKDGAAMAEFLFQLKKWSRGDISEEWTEIDAADLIEACRKEQEGYNQLSFTTITGYGSNGAIVHYSATPETNRRLQREGFLLVDCGAQYDDGTTDITRTIALGPLTEEMKYHYTMVLKGHIAMASARFTAETTGAQLDAIARKPLNDAGLDFNHGTGHGVGHLLCVHEGPLSVSVRGTDCTIRPGMITSNEPGLYLEGKYGIRLENEVLCQKAEDGSGDLVFEPLTWCPWEREAIVKDLLSPEEVQWVDAYHRQVLEKTGPCLKEEERKWLETVCMPL